MCDGSRRDPMEVLAAAVDGAAAYLAGAPSTALNEALRLCRRQQDRLEAAFTQAAGRFASNREFAAEGAVTAVSWLKANCRMSAGAAAERLTIARELDRLPATNDAFARGDIGYQHAALIARVSGKVGADLVREGEIDLLKAASDLDPNRFSVVTDHLRNMVDPDGMLADANRAYDQRHLHLSQSLDGMYFIDGRLDPESGAAVQTALNALSLPYPGDRRTPQQRRADALIELCHRHFQAGTLPEVGGQRPHLLVKVFASTLAGTPGSPAGDLNWGGAVPAATVRRLACDATLSVVALDENAEPLDGGRATRIISPSMRRALIARDGGCRFPTCDRPIDWTDAHHLKHWADGGETTKDNLVLLCRNHHHLIHAGGWQMVRGEDGAWVAIPPDRKGRAHPDPPASRSA